MSPEEPIKASNVNILWGDFPPSLQPLYRAQNGLCPYCGHKLSTSLRGMARRATIDHVVPRARGGCAARGNEVLAHAKCNFAKADREPYACEILFAAITHELENVILRSIP